MFEFHTRLALPIAKISENHSFVRKLDIFNTEIAFYNCLIPISYFSMLRQLQSHVFDLKIPILNTP